MYLSKQVRNLLQEWNWVKDVPHSLAVEGTMMVMKQPRTVQCLWKSNLHVLTLHWYYRLGYRLATDS